MSNMEMILTRHSVRSYVDNKMLTKEQLTSLLKAGMAAPTARDQRPWAFIAVNDREALQQLAAVNPHGQMLAKAGGAIIAVAKVDLAQEGMEKGFWIQDLSAATENILLAAHGMGLGGVWIGVYPIPERMAAVAKFANLPEGYVPFSVISLGYSDGTGVIKDKFDESRIHWGQW